MVMCCYHLTLPYKGANSKDISSKGISYESGKL